MFESFSAPGSRVHTPWGPRKSGMPESVEIPAPVSATTRDACAIQPRTSAMRFSDSPFVPMIVLFVPSNACIRPSRLLGVGFAARSAELLRERLGERLGALAQRAIGGVD